MRLFATLATTALALLACPCGTAQIPAAAAPPKASAVGDCLPGGVAVLRATLRGALIADLNWHSDVLQCDGSARPEGKGLRISIAGPLSGPPGSPPRRLRFVFGIDTTAGASGLPTNLTVIVEGEGLLFATRGDARCTTDTLQRDAQQTTGRLDARGFCTSPAVSVDGTQRLLLSSFDFSARLSQE